MAEHFLRFFSAQNHRKISNFADDAIAALVSHDWPGNMRELRNITERAVILCHGATVLLEHLPEKLKESKRSAEIGALVPISAVEEAHIRSVLAKAKSLEDAARILGIDTATLWRRRKDYNL
jgi:NtrC-family two-component system response regulator AlgB